MPQLRHDGEEPDGTNQESTTANAAGEYRFAAITAGRCCVQFQSPDSPRLRWTRALVSEHRPVAWTATWRWKSFAAESRQNPG